MHLTLNCCLASYNVVFHMYMHILSVHLYIVCPFFFVLPSLILAKRLALQVATAGRDFSCDKFELNVPSYIFELD